jgi:hypothetical protein
LLLSGSNATLSDILIQLSSLMALAIPVAAIGFFLNEWTDIESDKLAGKANQLSSFPPLLRVLLFIGLLFLLFLPFFFYHYISWVKMLFACQLLLFTLYSVPPFRLKRYPLPAVILDALYSGMLFYLIAIFMSVGSFDWSVVLPVALFGCLKGVRNILYHLQLDAAYDQRAGQRTAAHIFQPEVLQRMQEALWVFEMALLLKICLSAKSPTMIVLIIGFLMIGVKRQFYNKKVNKIKWLGELNTLYELWFPLAAILGVTVHFGRIESIMAIVFMLVIFPHSRKLFKEIYIFLYNIYYLFYNIYYFISDLYFIHTKPHFDIGRFLRKIKGK